jgi:hypothetical protein
MSNKSLKTNLETIAKQDRFLKAFESKGVISRAAAMAGISTSTVDSWRKKDIVFMEEMDRARLVYSDKLEGQLFDLIDEMHKHRDYKANPTLLIFALNGANPQKYKGLSQTNSDAKDVLSEFRKAMRESKDVPVTHKVDPKEEGEEKLVIKQASKFLSKFGSLNDTNS